MPEFGFTNLIFECSASGAGAIWFLLDQETVNHAFKQGGSFSQSLKISLPYLMIS